MPTFRPLIAALLWLFTLPAFAQGLTSAQVGAWLDTMEEVRTFARSHQDELDNPEGMGPDAAMAVYSRYADEFRAILNSHSFDPQSWQQVTNQVISAYMSLKMGEQQPEQQQELARSRQEIMNNGNLSAEQKQQLVQQMEMMQQQMQQMQQAGASDAAALRPHLPRLEKMMDE